MRKILSLFVALMTVFSLSAKTVYLYPGSSTWADANAITFIHAWGGSDAVTNVKMLPVEEGSPILSADAKDNTEIVFVRMAPGSEAINWDDNNGYWNKTSDQTITDGEDMFTVLGFSNKIANGSWSVYGAKFYITGDSAFVVDAGLDKAKTWAPDAIVSKADSKVLSLKANQTYKLLVTVDGTWNTKRQFDNLTDTVGGLFIDSDINICFRLATDGDVTVTYTNSEYTLSGDFAAPKVAIVGNFAGNDDWWVPVTENTMTPAGDKKSASVTFNVNAATYQMKVWEDGSFLSLNGGGESQFRIARDATTIAEDVNLYGNGSNFEFIADVTGNYTFTWTFATRNLVVTFPPTTPTAIDNTEAEGKAVKRIVNGQLVIEKNGVRYNALGIEVK